MSLNLLNADVGPEGRTCSSCVWHYVGGRGRAVSRCRRYAGARLEPDWAACAAYTEALDCLRCGACCREAYHAVEVGPRDPFVKKQKDRLVRVDGRFNIIRKDGICGCLAPADGCWPCTVYEDRPKTCRDFEPAGNNCIDARVRLGITP